MARPREFDTDDALMDAMNVFWEHGYDAASLPELLTGMGLTRGSLYKAFTDKKNLFLEVLNRYEIEAVDTAVALLTTEPADGAERIEALFQSVVEAVQYGDQRGCLLCSAAAGPAAVDQDISGIVQLQLNKMSEAFYVALTQSVAHANASEQDREDIAAMLLSQYVGLRTMVRSNTSDEAIRKSVDAIVKVVGDRRSETSTSGD
ncbi:TetR/AcrR family transcriptional regulator [Rhodobacteraceae bacterium]|nr:TetR/AcrR family transcriptional regulator [Paracoccaceae bacterium]